MNVEMALHSAAFLMDWASDIGNEDLDGPLTFGISRVLGHAAEEVGEMRLWITNEFFKPPALPTESEGRSPNRREEK
jgi:hypothetical protein